MTTVTTTGFAATHAAFEAALVKQRVGGASFSATVDGVERLTISGGEARAGQAWSNDTRAVTMSVAKGWAGLVVAMLADRGLLDPDERVATYWPEFAAKGKQDVLVRDVLLHTAGVLGLPRVADVIGWDGTGWGDLDAIAAALADAEPAWQPGTRTGYHAVTYGWLVGELVRRTDGRTLGAFLREEVCEPLGIRTAIGVPAEDQGDIATVHSGGMLEVVRPLRGLHRSAQQKMRDPSTLIGKASLGDGTRSIFDDDGELVNSAAWLAAEAPSSNGVTSARDLARLFALVANGGELDGVRLLSEKTLERYCVPQEPAVDVAMLSALPPVVGPLLAKALGGGRRTLAFLANGSGKAAHYGPSPRAVGAEGYGGQLVMADPDRKVSLAFVRSGLRWSTKEVGALVTAFYADLDA